MWCSHEGLLEKCSFILLKFIPSYCKEQFSRGLHALITVTLYYIMLFCTSLSRVVSYLASLPSDSITIYFYFYLENLPEGWCCTIGLVVLYEVQTPIPPPKNPKPNPQIKPVTKSLVKTRHWGWSSLPGFYYVLSGSFTSLQYTGFNNLIREDAQPFL